MKTAVWPIPAPNIGIRESRKINGMYKLTVDDLTGNVMFPDAVALGGYPIDVHSPDGNNSATQEACSSTRLTPIVMALGQAAGTAASQRVHSGEKASAPNTVVLRAQLLKDSAFLDEYQG